jgi:hypothetical protein
MSSNATDLHMLISATCNPSLALCGLVDQVDQLKGHIETLRFFATTADSIEDLDRTVQRRIRGESNERNSVKTIMPLWLAHNHTFPTRAHSALCQPSPLAKHGSRALQASGTTRWRQNTQTPMQTPHRTTNTTLPHQQQNSPSRAVRSLLAPS